MTENELTYRTLIESELQQVDEMLLAAPHSVPGEVVAALAELVNGGGKRLRPAVALLSAHIYGADLKRALPLAAAMELLHTATLIHDDIVDDALLRRGVRTPGARWNSKAAILIGDLVFAWAANLAVQADSLPAMRRFAETLEVICLGELRQMFQGGYSLLQGYYERISAKTASLFTLAAETGPLLKTSPPDDRARLRRFGEELGLAFQITDDVLDFVSDKETLGKPIGEDLHHGLLTLPMLYYLENHPEVAQTETLLRISSDEEALQTFMTDLRDSDAIDRALETAEKHARAASALLDIYPSSPYRDALVELTAFAVQRRY